MAGDASVSPLFWQHWRSQLMLIQLVVPSSLCGPTGSSKRGAASALQAIWGCPAVPNPETPVCISALGGHGTPLQGRGTAALPKHGSRRASKRELQLQTITTSVQTKQGATTAALPIPEIGSAGQRDGGGHFPPSSCQAALPGQCFVRLGVQSAHVLGNCEWQEKAGKGERASLAS